jgi:sulfite exporter TauE/SafE
MIELPFIAAILAGLLGGVHCVGMCGGIISALVLTSHSNNFSQSLRFLLAYNFGRISSYMIAGALVGGLSGLMVDLIALDALRQSLKIIAALFMILLGFYLSGGWLFLARIERLGGVLWCKIQPMAQKFIPVRQPLKAFYLGLFWGWLPCGLVYSLLIAAWASASAVSGALIMLGFGLGTLPTLLLVGNFAQQLKPWLQHRWVKGVAGSLVVAFGVAMLFFW